MKINVIATGSTSNFYEVIDNLGNSLLIEAGVSRSVFWKHWEGAKIPEMCIISHLHGDHAKFAHEYEMICPVYKWNQTVVSENFKAFGFRVKHGDVLNYAYLIKLIADDDFLFFATDLEFEKESIDEITANLKTVHVSKFLIECNYNDYLYHLADPEQRIGCDRHFSDNNLVKFIKQTKAKNPKIITIHGSERLSADSYTRKFIQSKIPNATVAVAVGAQNNVKNLFKL